MPSEAFKQHTIKHMISIVQMRILQETGKEIRITPPETEEDLAKLKVMYDKALEKYGKSNKSES